MNAKSNSQKNQSQSPPFVPRSVLMARESQSTKNKEKKKSSKKDGNVLEGSRVIVLKSIAGFLEKNGLEKSLKIFMSEASIEEHSWKSSGVNLDDVFGKFFDSSNVNETTSIENKEPEETKKENGKKNKKSKENAEESETLIVEKSTPVEEEKGEPKKETKEKKRKKKSNEREDSNEKPNVEKSTLVEEKINMEIKEKKKKNKKEKEEIKTDNNLKEIVKDEKKKEKEKNKDGAEGEKEIKVIKEVESEKNNEENGEKKVSKKRKKPDSDENELENNGNDENALLMENGNNETKSGKKEKSSEPKSANAFKRVKIEEVKFADERLQDNSYWAKDGAGSGYGAKAQQILEQVKGRGFRHEKTKKKRGSYRGGQIDLNSHSIKFNYSDEE